LSAYVSSSLSDIFGSALSGIARAPDLPQQEVAAESTSSEAEAFMYARAEEWLLLSGDSPDVNEDGRLPAATAVATKMRDEFNLSAEKARKLMGTSWYLFADPPLEQTEIKAAVSAVYSRPRPTPAKPPVPEIIPLAAPATLPAVDLSPPVAPSAPMPATDDRTPVSPAPDKTQAASRAVGDRTRAQKSVGDTTNSKLSAALTLAGKGFAIFPCRGYVSPGPNATPEQLELAAKAAKMPAISNWQNLATTDRAQIEAWWSEDPERNIGLPTNSLLVVDVDPKHGGDKTFQAMQLVDEFPKTASSATQSGGLHVIYGLPQGVMVRNNSGRLGPGIDVRSWGGYIVAPGSTIDGRSYRWFNTQPVRQAPQWLIERCNTRTPRTDIAGKRIVEEDDTAVELAEQWLHKHAPTAQHGTIDDTAFAVAARFYDFGVSTYTATDLLAQWSETHAFPPMQLDCIKVVAESAGRNRDNAIGSRHPGASGFEAVEIAPRVESTDTSITDFSRLKPMIFGELDRRTAKPVQELIPGLIEKHTVTFLSAPGGTHKSRIAVHWGRSIHNGIPVYGREVEQATFVYVSCEDNIEEVTTRAHTLKRRLSLPDNDASVYWNLVGKDAPLAIVEESGACKLQPFWEILMSSLKAIAGHKFIVLDGTYNVLRFAGQAKINETSVLAGIKLLTRICEEADATVLTLWHPSQAGQERGDASGWSVAWHNAPRARLSLTALKDRDDAFELKVEKRNHGRKGPPIILYWEDGMLLPKSEVTTANQQSNIEKAVIAVAIKAAAAGTPITTQRNLNAAELAEVQASAGWQVSNVEAKDILAAAALSGQLQYKPYHRNHKAGYYPPGHNPNTIGASGGSKIGVETGVETPLEPGFETQ
jgi:hypothetical protein